MHRIVLMALLSAAAMAAHGACPQGSKPLFFCVTAQGGKQIEVCADDRTVTYSFGKPKAAPELTLAVPRGSASTYQWEGIGRYENYSINLPKGATEYRVYSSFDKLAPRNRTDGRSAGVHVLKGATEIVDVRCKLDTLKESLQGVDLKRAEEW